MAGNASAETSPLLMPRYVNFCGETLDTYEYDIRERLEVRYYAYMRDKTQMLLWMKRTKRYFPIIEQEFKRRGLPEDLKYMAVVESSLIPRSYSSKGAVGLWQFIRDTGRRYGLTVRRRYDERRDPYRATISAAKYLQFLHDKFGSWYLAMAAYNIGEKRIEREVKEQGTDIFFEMVFPRETDEYIINALIVKHLMENPKLYGFELEEFEYFKPYEFTRVKIVVPKGKVPVAVIARASNATPRQIKNLNPQIIGNFLFKGTYFIRIPPAGEAGFKQRYAKNLQEYKKNNSFVKVVKRRANLRNGPGTDYKSVKTVKGGTKLKFVSVSDNLYLKKPWYEVEMKDRSFWVWSGLVTFLD